MGELTNRGVYSIKHDKHNDTRMPDVSDVANIEDKGWLGLMEVQPRLANSSNNKNAASTRTNMAVMVFATVGAQRNIKH